MKRGQRLRGAVRRARARLARARKHKRPEREIRRRKRIVRKWEGLLRAYRAWQKNPFPHLAGDLDADRDVLVKLERLAADVGRNFYVTSGLRSYAEQKRLWDNRASNPYPVARPGTSRHESGRAVDVVVGGLAIQSAVPASTIRKHGLSPLVGDAVHLEG